MTKSLKHMISFMMFVILVIVGIMITYPRQKSVVGTYCTGNGLLDTDVYLAIESANQFTLYHQFQEICSGTYQTDTYDRISVLLFEDQDGHAFTGIFDHQNMFILADGPEIEFAYPLKFHRTSDIPIYINVPGHA